MRFILATFFALLPLPLIAETLLASSQVTAVTLFPEGARITRQVRFDAPAGSHEVLITDLPAAMQPELTQVTSTDVSLGAFALRRDRLPPREPTLTAAEQAAEDAVLAAESGVQAAALALARIDAEVEAHEVRADFLASLAVEGGEMTAEAVQSLARMIGSEMLAAREAALAAAQPRPTAERALEEAQEALERAEMARDALDQGDEDYAALTVAMTAAAAGPVELTLVHYVYEVGWRPVYDMNLTRDGDDSVEVQRAVVIWQWSGEDWSDVALTLSTAQPSSQSSPSMLWPDRRQVYDPAEEMDLARASDGMAEGAAAGSIVPVEPEPVVVVESALASMQGDVVVYDYPTKVDVAHGVEGLRLALDTVTLTPEVEAVAVPRSDRTAFVVATVTNTSGEILLPGDVTLMREGTFVGSTSIDTLAPGDETEIAFGSIEGIRLRRDMPEREEGDRGILSGSTERAEQAVLEVKNLTDETWPVRLMDQVPYSEQEDLEISFTADPPPTEEDVDGKRGILAWDFDLAPGETKAVTLTHVLNWPSGMELR
jgi:uncharacterized protein (TIGR02231 family)